MIIDKKINSEHVPVPEEGRISIFVDEQGLRLKDSEGVLSTLPQSSRLSEIGDGSFSLGWDTSLNPGSSNLLNLTKEIFSLSFKARSRFVSTGGSPFFKPGDLSKAIKVRGTSLADLNAALTTASSKSTPEERVVLLSKDIVGVASQVLVPVSVTLLSLNGSKIISSSGTSQRIIVQTDSKVIGLHFENFQVQITQGSSPVKGACVIGCLFTGNILDASSAKIWDRGTKTLVNSDSVIAFNETDENNAYFIRWNNTLNFKVIGNKATYNFASGTFLFSRGGLNNEIAYNIQKGGKVGVICLFDRRDSRGFINNKIHNNWIEFVSEEGLSIDVNGNGFSGGTYFQGILDTVLTVNSSSFGTPAASPRVTVAKNNVDGIEPDFHALYINTGIYAGTYIRIASVGAVVSEQSVITLINDDISQDVLNALNVGGVYVSFVIRADGNIYDANTLINIRSPIELWGSGWNTTISHNKVIRTLDVLPELPPAANYSNVFKDNEISLSAVLGLNSHNNQVNGNTSLAPSNNFIYSNDAAVGFGGVGYSSLAQCEATLDAIPNTVGQNKEYNGVSNIRRAGLWTSTKAFFNIEELSGNFQDYFSRGSLSKTSYGEYADITETVSKEALSNTVSVERFGIKPLALTDNITDQTALIANAFIQASATNSTLFFPAGRYNVNGGNLSEWPLPAEKYGERKSVVSSSGCSMLGEPDLTFIHNINNYGSNNRFNFSGGRDITVKDIIFVGDNLPPSPTNNAPESCIWLLFTNCFNVKVENCKFLNTYGGAVLMRHCTNCLISGCYARDIYKDTFHITGTSSNITRINNTVINAGDDAFPVVGYISSGRPSFITDMGNTVRGVKWARGFAYVGASNIRNIGCQVDGSIEGSIPGHPDMPSNTKATCGLLITGESSFNTHNCEDIYVEGILIKNCGASSYGAINIGARTPNFTEVFPARDIYIKNATVLKSVRRGVVINSSIRGGIVGVTIEDALVDDTTNPEGVGGSTPGQGTGGGFHILNAEDLTIKGTTKNTGGSALYVESPLSGEVDLDIKAYNVNVNGANSSAANQLHFGSLDNVTNAIIKFKSMEQPRVSSGPGATGPLVGFSGTTAGKVSYLDVSQNVDSGRTINTSSIGVTSTSLPVTSGSGESTYTNDGVSDKLIQVNGTGVTLIQKGLTVGRDNPVYGPLKGLNGWYRVKPGETLKVTHTSTPTMVSLPTYF